jgi:hypothetical protein
MRFVIRLGGQNTTCLVSLHFLKFIYLTASSIKIEYI